MTKKYARFYEPVSRLTLLTQLVLLVFKMHFSIFTIPAAFSPDAALLGSLPRTVLEASELIKKHSLPDFSLSPELKDVQFEQRIAEFNYPVLLNDNSLIIVSKTGEEYFNKCKLIADGAQIAIYDCTNRKH